MKENTPMGAPRSSDAGKKAAGLENKGSAASAAKPAVPRPPAPPKKAVPPPAGGGRPAAQSAPDVASTPAPAPAAAKKRSLGKKPLLWGAGALLFSIGLVWLMLMFSTGGGLDDKPLAGLKDLQREWWNNHALGTEGCQDAEGALADLMDGERQWWLSEGLVDKNDPDSLKSFSRLEDAQRDWWKEEGLSDGKPSKDPEAARARLEAVNRRWWGKESLARSDRREKEGEPAAAAAAEDSQVTLADKEGTRRFLQAGGTEASEQAVALGLKWFASQQWPEGCWSHGTNPGRYKSPQPGDNTVVGTAFALLPFLARGETHKPRVDTGASEYTKPVENGLKYLLLQQKPDGSLMGTGNMYTHGLATIALCEALNMTSDPALREPAQKAVDFIVAAQDPKGGGWRYAPRSAGDTSVTSWQIQALKSGQMAGLHVPRETWEKATIFLNTVAMPDGNGYNYQRNKQTHLQPKPASMTACGMLCRQYLHGGESLASPRMSRGVEHLLAAPPAKDLKNIYYYYYATQVLFNIGDQRWQTWNPKMRDLLIEAQNQSDDPALRGSWDMPFHSQGGYRGRVMSTSLALLTLEVYYRHLPLNRPDLGNVAKSLEEKGKTPR